MSISKQIFITRAANDSLVRNGETLHDLIRTRFTTRFVLDLKPQNVNPSIALSLPVFGSKLKDQTIVWIIGNPDDPRIMVALPAEVRRHAPCRVAI